MRFNQKVARATLSCRILRKGRHEDFKIKDPKRAMEEGTGSSAPLEDIISNFEVVYGVDGAGEDLVSSLAEMAGREGEHVVFRNRQ